jgi:NifU-like protein involved in Fe-S cluster formation
VDNPDDSFEAKLQDAIANPKNMGEMPDADSIGTVGSADCGDMLRMFLKFTDKDGKKVIDRASFQSFGCQTAIAIASMATEMLKGKSITDAQKLSAEEMTTDLGPLPPVKIHCGQMVEGALRSALNEEEKDHHSNPADTNTLASSLVTPSPKGGKIKINITQPENTP